MLISCKSLIYLTGFYWNCCNSGCLVIVLFSSRAFASTLLVQCSFKSTSIKYSNCPFHAVSIFKRHHASNLLNISGTVCGRGDNRLTMEDSETLMQAKLLKTNLWKVTACDRHKTSILCETAGNVTERHFPDSSPGKWAAAVLAVRK